MSRDKPKVIAYCPLHYGAEYLDAAIRSVEKFVDEIIIYYTRFPSYGYFTHFECPEEAHELCEIAVRASSKVRWWEIRAFTEGEHRNLIFHYCKDKDYDLVLTFDADEVFEEPDLERALYEAYRTTTHRYFGIDGYVNFWRSFNHACYDGFTPIRIINLHNEEGQSTVRCKVYHFSCAQSEVIMRYKYDIHGHKEEIRPKWLSETYFGWTEGMQDLHPVAHGIWNAVAFDKETLPDSLKQHPNFNKEVI